MRARKRAAAWARSFARSAAVRRGQGPRSKASRAARAAAATCAGEQAGARPTISSVAGSTTAYVPASAGTHVPPISTRSQTTPPTSAPPQAACAASAASRCRVVEWIGSRSNIGRTRAPKVSIDWSTYFWSMTNVKGA